jgi:hypothetical protein
MILHRHFLIKNNWKSYRISLVNSIITLGHSDIEKKKDETLKYINSKLEKLRQLSSF